jgi:hypothetical protein
MSGPKFSKGPYQIGSKWDEVNEGWPIYDAEYHLIGHASYLGGTALAKANAELFTESWGMYQTLRDIRMNNAGTEERKRGWDNAYAIIERLGGTE